MPQRRDITALVQWLVIGGVVGCTTGAASALFLTALDEATRWRTAHNAIVWLLPLAGWLMGWVYERFGRAIAPGNNLVIDAIHDDGPKIPVRMAPMVLIGTVLTHLFGGSAGREGTAVQMGASLADALAHRFKHTRSLREHFLAAGVAGGFGSVFGTPIAGMIFGLEFVVLGSMDYTAMLPALVAALIGDWVTRSLGVRHSVYPSVEHLALTPWVLCKWLVFALAVAAVATVFIELTHAIKTLGGRYVPSLPWRMAGGGALVVMMWQASGTANYLGLGVPSIIRAFSDPTVPPYAFAAKVLFTAVTLGAGFLGGEVTPLFFVGACLGNVLARCLDLPLALSASVGMAAVFACASNTPLALSVMALELVGSHAFPHVVVVCVMAYVASGHRSIYPAQRVFRLKMGHRLAKRVALRDGVTTKR